MDTFSASVPDPHDEAIAGLNDAFRRTGEGGHVFLTHGVRALGADKVTAVLDAVRTFDAFTPANDRHGEHDFGAFEFEGQTLFWKIDYDDPALEFADEPSDPDEIERVLTVMLADEY